jgi:hypothetical protein
MEDEEKRGKFTYEFEFYNGKNRELINVEEFDADTFEEAYDKFRMKYSIENGWHIFNIHDYVLV